MSKIKSGRIILDEGAKLALSSMYEEIKSESCVKITPSKLASWIVSEYQKRYFKRDHKIIINKFFNTREYIKKILDETEDDEKLIQLLRKAQSGVKNKSKSIIANNGKEE